MLANNKLIIAVVAVAVGAAVGYYYGLLEGREKLLAEQQATREEAQKEVVEAANPFEDTQTNPFEGSYQNPFKSSNPFSQ